MAVLLDIKARGKHLLHPASLDLIGMEKWAIERASTASRRAVGRWVDVMITKGKQWTDETHEESKSRSDGEVRARGADEKRPKRRQQICPRIVLWMFDTTEQPRKRCYETRSRDLIVAE